MREYKVMEVVKIVKARDTHMNETGVIVDITQMSHVSVTAYTVKFDNGDKKYYFFSEIAKH